MIVKKGVAFICSLLLIGNQLPLSYITIFAEDEVKVKELTLNNNFTDAIIAKSKEYDGTTAVEVDLSNVKLEGVTVGDTVTIKADAEFVDANSGENKEILITNIDIVANDGNIDEYVLSLTDEQKEVSVYTDITPRTLWLEPVGYVFENEVLPKEISYNIVDGCILDADKSFMDVQSKLSIVEGEEEGTYTYRLDGETNTGNPNYIAAIIPDSAPEVRSADALMITEAVVSKKDATILEQMNSAVISNGSVYVDVVAESSSKYNSVKFKLSIDGVDPVEVTECEEIEKNIDANSGENKETIFRYKARFELSLKDGQKYSDFSNLTCIVDNGTESEAQTLKYTIQENGKIAHSFVIDNKEPDVVNISLNNDGTKEQFTANGVLMDEESGIKKIRYRWDADWNSQSTWKEVDSNSYSHQPGASVNFSDTVAWNVGFDTRPFTGGSHKLELEITDNVGNVYTDDGNLITNGSDTTAPEVTYIKLDKTTDSAWQSIVRFLSFGNFAKQELKLYFSVEDQSESEQINGIQTIEIIDENGEQTRVIEKIDANSVKDNDYIYEFDFVPNQKIENWCIRLTDKGGYSESFAVSELLKREELTTEEGTTEAATTVDGEATEITTTDTIDWNYIESNKWVFDNTAPTYEIIWGDLSVYLEGTHYYNNNGGEFKIKIADDNSLYTWEVIPTFKTNLSDEGKVLTEYKLLKTYSDEKNEGIYTVDTADLDNGWYTFALTATDNAGNVFTSINVATFYVDHMEPTGRIEVFSPDLEAFTIEKNWIKERINGEINPIVFRLYIETPGTAFNNAVVDINGGKKQFNFDQSDLKVDSETAEQYLEFTLRPDENGDPNGLSYNEDHTYDITAKISTYSGNPGNANYKLHVDTDNPTVNSFVVERSNTAFENVLNILTFGVFANDSLTLTVNVSDNEFDSGIDHVEINYNSLSKAEDMKPIGDGNYVFELPLQTNIFQSEITVTVYDKTGKVNASCPDIKNTTGDKSTKDNHFVMIETVAPELVVELPETDSTDRVDGQIWYRRHSNTEEGVEPADSEKMITVSVQDNDSGLRYVQMLVNGKDIIENSSDYEISGKALPTIASTEESNRRITESLKFQYSIEKIAEYIPANEDGSYIIEFRVVDNAGNATTDPVNTDGIPYTAGKVVYYRDIAAPTITEFSFDPTTADEITNTSDFIEELEYGFYFKRDFKATVTIDDAAPSSGYDRVIFKLVPYINGAMQNTEEYPIEITSGNQVSYTVRAGFKGQIYATVYDKVNNESVEKTPQAFVSDENAPEIIIEPLPDSTGGIDGDGNKLYTGNVQFKVTISDRESGLRMVSYSKTSEQDSFGDVVTEIGNLDGVNGETLANGWQIAATDANLITEISQVFTFDSDDNNISMTFNATDRSKNSCEPQTSEQFTIDTIAPQVSISNSAEPVNDMYFPGSATFEISVIERNFDETLMIGVIENSFGTAKPTVQFTDKNSCTHTATVIFGEGDFTFSLSGSDRVGHSANITFNGENREQYFFTTFNVDATPPSIKTNFSEFGKDDDTAIYYNAKQKAEAVITITEHNFNSEDVGLKIEQKPSGSSHTNDNWDVLNYFPEWDNSENSDIYTASIVLDSDSVYRISLNPIDRAKNTGVFEKGSPDHTPVFEVDTIAPTFEGRNDIAKNDENMLETSFYVVYAQSDKTADAPTVSFEDTNFDRIEYEYSICTPQYENGYELPNIAPNTNGDNIPSIQNKTFALSEVQSNWLSEEKNTKDDAYKEIPDGVYAMTFTAVDKAGNRSETIDASYFRMVNTDVLAYIYNSHKGENGARVGTGFYSLMDDDGIALSKKAADFQDIDVLVIKPIKDTSAGTLVLREDEKEYFPQDYAGFEVDSSEKVSDTAVLEKMHLPGSYFSETFRDDGLDTRMELSVSVRDGVYQWLGSIHIDNELPTATLPDDFTNWHNYFFEKETTITLTNISEPLDDMLSVVYECPRNGERTPIPHTYDAEKGTYSFTLSKGVHHIDVTLVDEAGNEWNIDRVRYIRVGNFRLYLGGGVVVVLVVVSCIILRRKRRI